MKNALSIDIEEYFQVHGFEKVIKRTDWNNYSSRVVESTHRILHLLSTHETRATFFILGWVAERFPSLVQEIASEGHEIACHGYWHELIYRQTPNDFAQDLQRSLKAIRWALKDYEQNCQPIGYRAPSFSITQDSLWALDILRNNGIRYDSSIFPLVAHDRYGIRNASRFASRLQNGLLEFPVSTVSIGKRNWPAAGGGYFRLFPLWLTRWAIRRINTEGHPAIIYLHPWEFDPHQPRIRNASIMSSFRHYVNLSKTESRLRALLDEFEFAPIREVFSSHLEVDVCA